jgi:hypothetical protein
MKTTYKTMDREHMGPETTPEYLRDFKAACAARQRRTGESDDEVTEHVWDDGNCGDRIAAELERDIKRDIE